jgi:AAA domain-containing protein/TrwC relaxase
MSPGPASTGNGAPDSLGYNEYIGAVAAIVSQHLEEALTARFGLEWTARDDGHGFEIMGISGQMMRLFSSRRDSITADLRARAARFEEQYGRAPSQREIAHLAQAANFKTRNPKHGALDVAQLHAGWADKLARTLGVRLASVAPSVWHGATGHAAAYARGANGAVLDELELARATQKAVALAQQDKSTWTRADVIKYLGRVLPRSGMNPAQAAALLEDLADRALRSEFEPVVCLEAPEPAEVPRSLLRADGRSVYQRHGGTRYATRAQLAMEERMVARAGASGAPRLTRAQAARALGAGPAQLEDALTGHVPDADAPRTQTGLRADQAAAAMSVLTDGKRVSVINAPAKSGKTYVLTQPGKAWAAGLGPVIGTAAQSARNTLAAGVPVSYNSAQFLGHLPGRRGARGPVETGQRPLLLVDEASTMPGPDLADLIAYAQARDGKLILAGDTSQLQAVENGGGMSLLAGALGYARLAEPARFRAAWEQQASLRLRDGDTTVLADYDQHGRILGGDPEQMMDAAAAAYVALAADGTDTLLMAAEHALRRELSRRIREDLIALGIVEPGPAVRIADGATASPGDLITCTRNDHTLQAGEPGRMLANGDLLRIEAVTAGGLVVRRALDADPATGRRRWTDRTFLYQHFGDAELGYAVTDHVAQGRTVHTGLAVITGTEDRQHGYVALTRGTDANLAYVFTTSPKRADPVPGPRPAPELARYDQIQSERNGGSAPLTPPAAPGEALGVLATVLGRDGQQQSATQAPPAGPRRRRPPGRPGRDLDRRDHPSPPAALPRPAHEHRAARLPDPAESPGPVAVPDPARRRTGRPGPRPDPGRRDRRTGPGRIPRPGRRPGRPDPLPARHPRPAPGRAVVRAGPRHRRPRTPYLSHRDRRDDGRPQGPHRRTRRRARPALGGQRPRPGPRAPAGPAGLAEAGRLRRRLAGTIQLPPPGTQACFS